MPFETVTKQGDAAGNTGSLKFGRPSTPRPASSVNGLLAQPPGGAGVSAQPDVGHLRDAALAMLIVMPGEWPEGETFDEAAPPRAGEAGGPHRDRPRLSVEPSAPRCAEAGQRARPRGALPDVLTRDRELRDAKICSVLRVGG